MSPRPFSEELPFNWLITPAQMEDFALVWFSSPSPGSTSFSRKISNNKSALTMQDLRLLVPDPNLPRHRHRMLKGERTDITGSSFKKFLVGQSVISRLYFRSYYQLSCHVQPEAGIEEAAINPSGCFFWEELDGNTNHM